ncbi:MAG: dihydrodipicolinate synthase family protein [Caldilineaceae bacterium]|nr:dihydrodipicolinate synthase family protein [Caldilineaceae bacterium]
MTESSLRGVFAPVLTPMQADLSPDVPKWIAFCKQLLANGCTGLAPFGTTSEANSFGLDERMEMLDQLVAEGVPAAALMPGVGTCAIPDTVKLSAQAAKLGCGGVLMLPPFYYKGVSDDGIFAAIAEVIERVGDERLRVYLYHIPPIAQVGFSLKNIERLIKAYPQSVVGMKDSSGDWNNLRGVLTSFPGFGTFTGSERFLLQTLRLGGAGTISAMANVIPDRIRQLYEHYQDGNAESLQADLDRYRETTRDYAAIPALKQVMADRTGDEGWLNIRPPLTRLAVEQVEDLRARWRAAVQQGAAVSPAADD